MTSISTSFEKTVEGKTCYNITDTTTFLNKIKDEIEKILKGTNPTDNRNRLLVLYQDIIAKITAIKTYEELAPKRVPTKIVEQTKKVSAIHENLPPRTTTVATAADGRYSPHINQKRIAYRSNTLPLSPRSTKYNSYYYNNQKNNLY